MISESLDKEAILKQVKTICRSPEFHSKQVLCRFLTYIVSELLAGRGDDIKAYSIGVDVFKRDQDFDPGQDTLVRINAIRLRRMLDLYYSNTGKNDELRIWVPKGRYIPEVMFQSGSFEEERIPSSGSKNLMTLEPSVAIFSFKDLSGDPDNTYFARGFPYELLVEMTKFEDLLVYNYLSVFDPPHIESPLHTEMLEKGIRFTVGGAIQGDRERIQVLVDLRDFQSGRQVWSERYSKKLNADNFIEVQESIAKEISGILGNEYGIILHRLSMDAERQKPRKWSTYTAILKYYNYLVQNTPESTREAFEALNEAVETDPGSGAACAALSALHGAAYSLDYPGADQSYLAAGEYAEKAYLLDPYSLFVLIALGYKHFIYDEKELFFQIADRILKKNPNSTLRLGALGFHLALYGDWERGKRILDSVIQGNFEYPKYLHGATTLYYYRKEVYEEALREARMYQVPGFFWGSLLRAAVLGQLGRPDEAGEELQDLLKLKPDFRAKAHYLISRFVKEEPLVRHITAGLQKAGLSDF